MHHPHNRRLLYDAMLADFLELGADVKGFLSDREYFGVDPHGCPYPWQTQCPTLVHWPLADYPGGPALIGTITKHRDRLKDIIGPATVSWTEPEFWHSTVFAPCHSNNPADIARAQTDISIEVVDEVARCEPYCLRFSRIVVTRRCGVLALAYADNDELDSLRRRLLARCPDGSASRLIHITLGTIAQPIANEARPALREYLMSFKDDKTNIGEINIKSLTYAIFMGPITKMSLTPIFSLPVTHGSENPKPRSIST